MINPLVVLWAALADSLNPCAFSVLFLTIGFLFSLQKSRREIVNIGLLYIFGIFLVYIGIGLGILRVLDFFQMPHFMARVGALIIILMGGLRLLKTWFPSIPVEFKIPDLAHKPIAAMVSKASGLTALALGGMVGLYEFPCTGGPYLFILGLLHDKATFIQGFWYLTLYNTVFVMPLVVALLVASNERLLHKVQEWKKTKGRQFSYVANISLIVLGVIILATSF